MGRGRNFPWSLHEQVGALGSFGFGIDEEYGGLGFDDCFMRAAFAEEFSRCGASGIPATLGARNISRVRFTLASEAIKRRVLPPVLAGDKGSSLAITEPSGGSDVANMQTPPDVTATTT